MSLDGFDRLMNHQGQEGVYDGVIVLSNANDYWHLSYGNSSPDFGQNCRFEPSSVDSDISGKSGNIKAMLDSEAFPVMVITQMNASGTGATARCYELPKGCAEVIVSWQWKLLWRGSYRDVSSGRTAYNIILKDGDGNEVAVRSISFTKCRSSEHDGRACEDVQRKWRLRLVCDADDPHGREVAQRWIGFDIPRDDLPKIKAVSVELAD